MFYAPKHRPARRPRPLRNRIAGVAIAGSATFVSALSLSPPAQAAGSVWDRVAACESGGRWTVDTGNGYYGGLQFSASTWQEFGGGGYAPSANRATKSIQIGIARRVLGVQGPGAWPVCSKRAGLNRVNGQAASMTVSRARARVDIHAGLAVDGRLGPRTITAVQRWVGAPRIGIFGPKTTKALQRRVGVRADGKIGPRTVRALQVRIGAGQDGARSLTPATVAALQRYLNGH